MKLEPDTFSDNFYGYKIYNRKPNSKTTSVKHLNMENIINTPYSSYLLNSSELNQSYSTTSFNYQSYYFQYPQSLYNDQNKLYNTTLLYNHGFHHTEKESEFESSSPPSSVSAITKSESDSTTVKKYSTQRSKRRSRTQYTKNQVDGLEAVFIKQHYPEVHLVDKLSEKLNISIEKISVWFQNRRAKFKKSKKFCDKNRTNNLKENILDVTAESRNVFGSIHNDTVNYKNISPPSLNKSYLNSSSESSDIQLNQSKQPSESSQTSPNNSYNAKDCYYEQSLIGTQSQHNGVNNYQFFNYPWY